MKAEYWIYVGFMALAAFVAYKVIKGEKDKEPNYAAEPEFYNPLS